MIRRYSHRCHAGPSPCTSPLKVCRKRPISTLRLPGQRHPASAPRASKRRTETGFHGCSGHGATRRDDNLALVSKRCVGAPPFKGSGALTNPVSIGKLAAGGAGVSLAASAAAGILCGVPAAVTVLATAAGWLLTLVTHDRS